MPMTRVERLARWVPWVAGAVLLACLSSAAFQQFARARLDPRARTILAQLRSPDPRTRSQAIPSLANGRRETVKAVVPELVRLLSDETPLPGDPQAARAHPGAEIIWEDTTVAHMAAAALCVAGDLALEPLARALDDPEPPTRRGAALALALMAGSSGVQVDPERARQVAGPALRRALTGPDAAARPLAAVALCQFGDRQGLDVLLQAATDGPVGIRRLALSALGPLQEPRAMPVLQRALADQDAPIRRQAVLALAHYRHSKAADQVLAALKDPDAGVRTAAAGALGATGDYRAVAPLFTLLKDPDSQVYDSAQNALASLRDSRALPAFLAQLKQSDPALREQALRGVAQVGGPGVIAPMADLLRHTTDPHERRWAIAALGAARDPRALDPLFAAAQQDTQALYAIGRIGGPRAEQFLLARLRSPEWLVRRAAIQTLAQMRSRAAVPAIMAIAREVPPRERPSVVGALCLIADPRAMPMVVPLLQERDVNLRLAAAQALGDMGDPRALPHLRPLRGDRDPMVQAAVVIAMGKLGDHSVFGALLGYLRDPQNLRGEYRLEAARALARLKDPTAVPALIEALRAEVQEEARVPLPDGRPSGVTTAVAEALRAITGQHFGSDAEAWQRWWDEQPRGKAQGGTRR